jgi:hypothetical protein
MFSDLNFKYISASSVPILVPGRENSGIKACVVSQIKHLILVMIIDLW